MDKKREDEPDPAWSCFAKKNLVGVTVASIRFGSPFSVFGFRPLQHAEKRPGCRVYRETNLPVAVYKSERKAKILALRPRPHSPRAICTDFFDG
jgi:hypothetical protein